MGKKITWLVWAVDWINSFLARLPIHYKRKFGQSLFEQSCFDRFNLSNKHTFAQKFIS